MIDFSALYDQTIDRLFAMGARMTGDREMLSDCIQDVFVKLYTKRGELEMVENIESYLFVSLRNRLNDEFRIQSHRYDNETCDNYSNVVADSSENDLLEQQEEENRKQLCINTYMQELSPRQQQIVRLFFIEQMKYEDICKVMGINYQSARNLIHRSVSRLRMLASAHSASMLSYTVA